MMMWILILLFFLNLIQHYPPTYAPDYLWKVLYFQKHDVQDNNCQEERKKEKEREKGVQAVEEKNNENLNSLIQHNSVGSSSMIYFYDTPLLFLPEHYYFITSLFPVLFAIRVLVICFFFISSVTLSMVGEEVAQGESKCGQRPRVRTLQSETVACSSWATY